jgi:hypothetical protein
VQPISRYWLVLAGTAAGAGWLLTLVHVPAAWFLGPMAVAGAVSTRWGKTHELPAWILLAAQAIIGSALSTTFTPSTLDIFLRYWFVILAIIAALLSISLASGWLLAHVGRLDLATALLGMLPGGAPGMVALSEELDADTRLVAVMQTLRIMLVVGLLAIVAILLPPADVTSSPDNTGSVTTASTGVPWLLYGVTLGSTALGAWAGLATRLPAGALVGPALLGSVLGAVGIAHAVWPPLVLDITYALIGISVGLQFDVEALREIGRLTAAFVISTLALIGSAALLGWLLVLLVGIDPLTAYLATTPGGLNVVAILSLESGANAPLVIAIGLLRFLAILLLGPWLVRWCISYS